MSFINHRAVDKLVVSCLSGDRSLMMDLNREYFTAIQTFNHQLPSSRQQVIARFSSTPSTEFGLQLSHDA
jgi:hypothetical protein